MPTPESVAKSWVYSSRVRFAVSVACGLLAGGLDLSLGPKVAAALVGWDVAAAVTVLWVVSTVFRLKRETTAGLASSEDPDRATSDLLMVLASIASLGAVGLVLAEAGKAEGKDKLFLVLAAAISVVVSWLLVHTLYTLRYARIYYDERKGGIDFNSDEDPAYSDFAYLAFTVGMTFQVSDTQISDPKIRRVLLHHALLSYLFGTVIVATTINLVAGLSK